MNGLGQRDWPDQLVVTPNGRVVFFEFKRDGEQPEGAQLDCIQDLQARGCNVYVVTQSSDAIEILSRYDPSILR